MRIAQQVDTEMNQLLREREDLPPNAQRRSVILQALALRQTELDLLTRKLNQGGDQILASMDKMNAHIRALKPVQSQLLAHKATARKAFRHLAAARLFARLVIAVPPVIALVVTVLLDRLTPWLERSLNIVLHRYQHDVILFVLFVTQIVWLTPIGDAISTRLCWRSFDQTMGVVSSELRALREMENTVVDAEQQVPSLFARLSKLQ